MTDERPTNAEILAHQKKLRELPKVWLVADNEGIPCGVFDSKEAADVYRAWCKKKFRHSYSIHSEPVQTLALVTVWLKGADDAG